MSVENFLLKEQKQQNDERNDQTDVLNDEQTELSVHAHQTRIAEHIDQNVQDDQKQLENGNERLGIHFSDVDLPFFLAQNDPNYIALSFVWSAGRPSACVSIEMWIGNVTLDKFLSFGFQATI